MKSETHGDVIREMHRDAAALREVDPACAALIGHYARSLERIGWRHLVLSCADTAARLLERRNAPKP